MFEWLKKLFKRKPKQPLGHVTGEGIGAAGTGKQLADQQKKETK